MGSNSITLDPVKQFGAMQAYWGFTSATGSHSTTIKMAIGEIPQATETVLRKYGKNVTTGTQEVTTTFEGVPGDVVEYHLQAEYIEGWANWENAVIKDIVPEGITVDMSSVTLNGQAVTASWEDDNVLAIPIGTLGGNTGEGQEANPLVADVRFRATINNDVQASAQIINQSYAWGEWREIESNDVIIQIPAVIPPREICFMPGLSDDGPKFTDILISTLMESNSKPDNTAKNGALVIESDKKGFVLTRVANTTLITETKEGMLVFDESDNLLKYYTPETGWKTMEKFCFPATK